ncbi:GNAT family N-acetyltransferase [Parachitinimonas caeni]|uniref:GNAT family N-acetyltransferase n=1 Tax=Parachitinimonas caeni TaxID=3031301 RepID=A0ABT7E3D3_9NEIS|nr:GNAT family N-acetyltransferase [Parachitinimonas caeni]MDK2126828.1 GNAT family N-acetyltransferase [Parachitinimonas caeni]
MSAFSKTIESFWKKPYLSGEIVCQNDQLIVSINPDLDEDRRVMMLDTGAQVLVVMTPAVAGQLGLSAQEALTEATLRQRLGEANIALHGADYIFHFTEADKARLLQEANPANVRQLTEHDEAAFAEFQASASEQDLDDAYVELDHWAVFGAFDDERLIAATSMYPWDDGPQAEPIADTGVLTLPPFRGKGHARAVVRAISRHACQLGYEPQYRCQTDNQASTLLAKSAGLTLYGKWEVVSPDADE